MINKLRTIALNNKFKSNIIYLLYKITNKTGFFYYDNKIMYMIKNDQEISYKSFDTSTLSLRCNIKITNIEDDSSFQKGNYNIIIFNSDIKTEEFVAFVSLCELYSKNIPDIKFDDFFFQLSRIFQIPKEESFNNLIGFFGELIFIWEIYNKYGICLAEYWHVNGSNDIYDFGFKTFNCEIKTTLNDENIFKIKHKQLFNSDTNYIIINNIYESPTGMSIQKIIDFLNEKEIFSSNLKFQMKLEEEKKKCSYKQLSEVTFTKNKSFIYLNKDLETLDYVPQCISDISYNYAFDDEKTINIEDLICEIRKLF